MESTKLPSININPLESQDLLTIVKLYQRFADKKLASVFMSAILLFVESVKINLNAFSSESYIKCQPLEELLAVFESITCLPVRVVSLKSNSIVKEPSPRSKEVQS